MNETKFSATISSNRQSLSKFGGLFGKSIFKAKCIPLIPGFAEELRKANGDNGTCGNGSITFNRTPKRYVAIRIDIENIGLDFNVDGTPVVVLNAGKKNDDGESLEVRCPIDSPQFALEANTENVTKALNNGLKTPMFFTNIGKLNDVLNDANASERERLHKLIERANNALNNLDRTIEVNSMSSQNYYAQLDGKSTAEHNVEIKGHVEI